MRATRFWLLLTAAMIAACQAPGIPSPSEPSASPSPRPSVHGTTNPGPIDAFRHLRGRVLIVGEAHALEAGTAEAPITWRLVDHDRDRATLAEDAGSLTPLVPGGLTLEAREGDRRAWVHFAVLASRDLDRAYFSNSAPSHPAFPEPVVVRDAATWGRVWAGWVWASRMASWSPPPSASPGEPPPPLIPPPPAEAPGIAFPDRAVLLVDVQARSAQPTRPVVTHVEGSLIHLAVPDVQFEDTARPERMTTSGCAFDLPAPAAGASVRLAPFAEAPGHAAVSSHGESEAPFQDASPGPVLPPGQDDVRHPSPSPGAEMP